MHDDEDKSYGYTVWDTQFRRGLCIPRYLEVSQRGGNELEKGTALAHEEQNQPAVFSDRLYLA